VTTAQKVALLVFGAMFVALAGYLGLAWRLWERM
jgi:hypothetical protein